MKIVLYGVETNNKGAELMLYAILQEIERRYPKATVYIPHQRLLQGIDYLDTNVKVKYWPYDNVVFSLKLRQIFSLLHLPLKHLQDIYAVKNADYFIDGSGLFFSDKWNYSENTVWHLEKMLQRQYRNGTKIVYLPQGFGPLEHRNTKRLIQSLNRYASVIMPRESVSFNYLKESGLIDMKKVHKFTDFTSLVEGKFPEGYERLKDGICIIPNMRMVDKGATNIDNYFDIITTVYSEAKKVNKPIYILNHEGYLDEKLSYQLRDHLGGNVEVVTRLNALQVKGLISSAYLVITSRFHGLASALNSAVPCLATSWSHKYEELYKDYGMSDCLLPLDNNEAVAEMVASILVRDNNVEIRRHLGRQKEHIQEATREMWNLVWSIKNR